MRPRYTYRCDYCHDEMDARFEPSHRRICGAFQGLARMEVERLLAEVFT